MRKVDMYMYIRIILAVIAICLVVIVFGPMFSMSAETSAEIKMPRESVTVFDIPLNANLQEIVSILEKKNIDLRGYVPDSQWSNFIHRSVRVPIERLYKYNAPLKTEEALKVLDEKIRYFSFEYKGKRKWLTPESLIALARVDLLPPVLIEQYDAYNSQFALQLRKLPPDMVLHGIHQVFIYLVSINQNEPKSFLINLRFPGFGGNPEVVSILTEKYGPPKLYIPADDKSKCLMYNRLKKIYPNYEEKKPGYTIFLPELAGALMATDSIERILTLMPFRVEPGGLTFYEVPCFFEWNYGDTKINMKARAVFERDRKGIDILPEGKILVLPLSLNYTNYSLAQQVVKMHENIQKEMEKVLQGLEEGASNKF